MSGPPSYPANVFSTSTGSPVYKDQLDAVQVASVKYPVQLLQDVTLLDDIRHFSRERIPERVLHAKGTGAHGYVIFDTTEDLSKYTVAQPLQPGNLKKKIEITTRFSTVEGQAGSADTVRTFRGFATKLKTDVGNWDWVFISLPVFSIRDPAKLIGLAHAQGRDPEDNIFKPNRSYDSFSSNPETVHQLLRTLGDAGIPNGYTFMDGYSVNPFSWVNKKGEIHYVKMQLLAPDPKPPQKKFLDSRTAEQLAGSNPDYFSQTLYDEIKSGKTSKKYPTWSVQIQIMPSKEAQDGGYIPFDATKIWPANKYKPITIGELVLTDVPKNNFAEIEQLAFSPGTLIPGITPSPDPILQTRLVFYPDTQTYRLGSANFQQLPTNKPKCPVFNFQRDGFMAFNNQPSFPNYNSHLAPPVLQASDFQPPAYVVNNPPFPGQVIYLQSTLSKADFVQPREFWEGVKKDAEEKKRLVDNAVAALKPVNKDIPKPGDKPIQREQLRVYDTVEHDLTVAIAEGLGWSAADIATIKPLFQ